MKYVNN